MDPDECLHFSVNEDDICNDCNTFVLADELPVREADASEETHQESSDVDQQFQAEQEAKQDQEEEKGAIESAQEGYERAKQIGANIEATARRIGWTLGKIWAVVSNPAFWITAAVAILIFVVANLSTTAVQTVGAQEVQVAGGSGASEEMLERLAQRATMIQDFAKPGQGAHAFGQAYPNGYRIYGLDNDWTSACVDIVGYIYGIPAVYSTGNGYNNAQKNYELMKNAGLEAQAWWFPGSASPGAVREQPPAGAIVSTGAVPGNQYGHAFVMLTNELIIDNSATIPGKPGTGPRKLSERDTNVMTGWFVPPNEGYEGTYMNDFPDLPPVPDWYKQAVGASA